MVEKIELEFLSGRVAALESILVMAFAGFDPEVITQLKKSINTRAPDGGSEAESKAYEMEVRRFKTLLDRVDGTPMPTPWTPPS